MSDCEFFVGRMLSPARARVSKAAAVAAAGLIRRGEGKFGLVAHGRAASGRRDLARAAQ